MSKLKDKVLEIAEIANACPESLRTLCFEMLLRDLLNDWNSTPKPRGEEKGMRERESPAFDPPPKSDPQPSKNQDDISEGDLHIKARNFMKRYGVTMDQLNNLFYKEGDDFKSLYEDLRTTRMAESQIRIALLQSLRNAMIDGEFRASVEDIRQEASARKCYDVNNFTRIFTNYAGMFDFGEKFDKSMTIVKLSEQGRKELYDVIKELQ